MTSASTKQLPEKYIGRRMNPEFVKLWESYLDEGMSSQHVAEVFGVHDTTVRRYYPDKVWSHAQVSAHGTAMKHHNAKMRKLISKNY